MTIRRLLLGAIFATVMLIAGVSLRAQCLPGFCAGGFWPTAPTEYSIIDYTPTALGDPAHKYAFSSWIVDPSGSGTVLVMWEERTLDNIPTGHYAVHRRLQVGLGRCHDTYGFPEKCGPGAIIN